MRNDNAGAQTVTIHSMIDERNREDQALLLSRERGSLLNRPFRKALRKSTFISDFEALIDDFQADNVPLTGAYEESHDRRHLGRFSLRVRPHDHHNPVEVAYKLEGWKVATATERLKVGFERPLADNVWISLRAQYDYGPETIDLSGDLHYEMSRDTHVHVLVGDKMDIVTGSTMYPVVHSPVALRAVDQSPGVMLYVEHMF